MKQEDPKLTSFIPQEQIEDDFINNLCDSLKNRRFKEIGIDVDFVEKDTEEGQWVNFEIGQKSIIIKLLDDEKSNA